jgi:hypothetical protein
LFGFPVKWKRNRRDRLSRLAEAIEAIGEQDRKLIEESARVDHLRSRGAVDLHSICRAFVDKVNARLSEAAVLLDPPAIREENFNDSGSNLFQINLRGRLLQLEFAATAELFETDDFRRPYILRGSIRRFNQELLDSNTVDEQLLFCCPSGDTAPWYFFDPRTYRTGRVSEDYLIGELERLL